MALQKTISRAIKAVTIFTAFTLSPLALGDEAIKWEALNLEQAFNYALEHNHDIQTIKERIRQQEGVVIDARANRLPRLDANAQIQRTDSRLLPAFGGQTFGVQNSWAADVTISQNIFNGGRDYATHERERLRLDAAKYEVESVVNNVMLAVQESFASILDKRAQLNVRQKSTELLEVELKNEEAKFRAGTVSDFNVLRAKVEVANSLTPLVRARNELRLAREELRRVLGLENSSGPNQEVDVTGELTFVPRAVDLEESIRSAISARPELKRLRILEEAEEKGVTIARAGYLPTLTASAGYAVQQSPFDPDLNDTLDGWKVGAVSQWNIFNSFGTDAQVDQAKSAQQQARISLQRAILDAEVDTRRAVSSLMESQQLVKSSQQVVEQADEGLRRAKVRLDSGVGTQLEVLDAQVALTEARSNEVSALFEFVLSSARYDQAVGQNPALTQAKK